MKRLPAFFLLLVLIFTACTDSYERRLQQLYQLQADNRADSLMTNDTLARDLADYFDRHGTPNDRMLAYYLLGRTYADLGQAPQAIQSYQNAIDRVERLQIDGDTSFVTTVEDCDYYTLCRVYAQMSDVFYYQDLLDDNLRCLDMSIRYALKANDTITAINSYAHKLGTYDKLNMTDSIIAVTETVYCSFCSIGMPDIASRYLSFAISAYTDKGEYDKARYYINVYESESGFFDQDGNIEPGREAYYDIKGKYYLATNKKDSAEYFFRKELQSGMDYNNQILASLGLVQIYQSEGNTDSVAKYSIYSYAMSDSLHTQMATIDVGRIQAMYDYSNYLIVAQQEKERADKEREKGIFYLTFIILLVVIGCYIYYRLRQRRKAVYAAYLDKISELESIQSDVLRLRFHETEMGNLLLEKEEKMERLRTELEDYRQKEKLTKKTSNSQLQASSVYQELLKTADTGKLLTNENWHELNKLVIEILPGFYQFITSNKHLLSINEHQTAILIRLHIKPKPISNLMGVTPQYISKLIKQLSKKLFQEEGNGKILEEKLSRIS